MHFRLDDSQAERYRRYLSRFTSLTNDAVQYLIDAYKLAETAQASDDRIHHTSVLMLALHAAEQIDAIGLLASAGAAEPCKTHLRSAFEALLGAEYILEEASEERGLAYQVAHAHREIKLCTQLDTEHPVGRQLRSELAGDELFSEDMLPERQYEARVSTLEAMLASPPFAPVEEAWQAYRQSNNRAPNWFSLSDGPRSVRDLAVHLRSLFMYEFLYRAWSTSVHAGDGMSRLAKKTETDPVSIRPLRHPEGLITAIRIGVGLALQFARTLVTAYGDSSDVEIFDTKYRQSIQTKVEAMPREQGCFPDWR